MLDKLLNDNGLFRKVIPPTQNSLMKAISDALYFTTHMHESISKTLVQYAEKIIQLDLIPKNLSILKTNHALRSEYCKTPYLNGFEPINLQLVSMKFRVKINMYKITDGRLTCRIWNSNYVRMIELCKDEMGNYHSIYSKQFINNARLVQTILYDILDDVTQQVQQTVQKQRGFKNIEMELWMGDKLQNVQVNSKNRSQSQDNQLIQNNITKEIENIKKKEEDCDKTSEVISNLKSCPPGLDNTPKIVQNDTPSKKPLILEESVQRFNGRLKFFDEAKSFGFIVLDQDGSDIFVHIDDLQRAGITKEYLRSIGSQYKSTVSHYGKGNTKAPYFSFQMMTYMGKYNKSRKAIDLKLIPE